jgi:hypothetical protein
MSVRALGVAALLVAVATAGCGGGGSSGGGYSGSNGSAGGAASGSGGSSGSSGGTTGGSGGAGSSVDQAPVLTALTVPTDSLDFMAGAGRAQIDLTVHFTDAESDVASLQVALSDGTTAAIPVSSASATAGQSDGEFNLATAAAGKVTAQVWVVDRAGNSSNRMNAVLTVRGSARLSALTLSPGPIDPAFAFEKDQYAEAVDFAVKSVSVAAEALERAAHVLVNGTPMSAGVPFPVALVVGDNKITVRVTSSDGVVATYTINVRRRGDARLADLTLSDGSLDQVFQPDLKRYTATVGLLHPTTTVTPTAEDPRATVKVDGDAVVSGATSHKRTLDAGSNEIAVTVTAADGVTTADYTIDVTRRTAQSFAQELYVKSDAPQDRAPIPLGGIQGSLFGAALAFDGDTLAAGAWGEDSLAELRDSGAVYVYSRDGGGVWREDTKLITPNPIDPIKDELQHFGVNVAMTTAELFVAEIWGLDATPFRAPDYAGRVDVFTRQQGQWIASQVIVPNVPAATFGVNILRFGTGIAVQNNTLVVSDPEWGGIFAGNQSHYDGSGGAFVFERTVNGWVQIQELTPPAGNGHIRFGETVALDGDTLAIGAPGDNTARPGQPVDPMADSGAVYVYHRQGNDVWSLEAVLNAPNADQGDEFGGAVALSGDTLAVGAGKEDSSAVGIDGNQADNGAPDSGAVYVFARDQEGHWKLEAYIKASNSEAADGFGAEYTYRHSLPIALRGDVLAVGASAEAGGAVGINGDQSSDTAAGAGAVYVFTRNADRNWTQVAYLKASNTDPHDEFGNVALAVDSIVVGAPGEASTSPGLNADQSDNGPAVPSGFGLLQPADAGAVYVFR